MSAHQQRERALARAMEVRRFRGETHRRVAAGEPLMAFIDHPWMASQNVYWMLCWQRAWRDVKAARACAKLGIEQQTRVRELSIGKKLMLADLLGQSHIYQDLEHEAAA